MNEPNDLCLAAIARLRRRLGLACAALGAGRGVTGFAAAAVVTGLLLRLTTPTTALPTAVWWGVLPAAVAGAWWQVRREHRDDAMLAEHLERRNPTGGLLLAAQEGAALDDAQRARLAAALASWPARLPRIRWAAVLPAPLLAMATLWLFGWWGAPPAPPVAGGAAKAAVERLAESLQQLTQAAAGTLEDLPDLRTQLAELAARVAAGETDRELWRDVDALADRLDREQRSRELAAAAAAAADARLIERVADAVELLRGLGSEAAGGDAAGGGDARGERAAEQAAEQLAAQGAERGEDRAGRVGGEGDGLGGELPDWAKAVDPNGELGQGLAEAALGALAAHGESLMRALQGLDREQLQQLAQAVAAMTQRAAADATGDPATHDPATGLARTLGEGAARRLQQQAERVQEVLTAAANGFADRGAESTVGSDSDDRAAGETAGEGGRAAGDATPGAIAGAGRLAGSRRDGTSGSESGSSDSGRGGSGDGGGASELRLSGETPSNVRAVALEPSGPEPTEGTTAASVLAPEELPGEWVPVAARRVEPDEDPMPGSSAAAVGGPAATGRGGAAAGLVLRPRHRELVQRYFRERDD